MLKNQLLKKIESNTIKGEEFENNSDTQEIFLSIF